MDDGSIPTCEGSRFSSSDWVHTLKSRRSFLMRLAKQRIMFTEHKTFGSNKSSSETSLIGTHSPEHSSALTFPLSSEWMLFPVFRAVSSIKKAFQSCFH